MVKSSFYVHSVTGSTDKSYFGLEILIIVCCYFDVYSIFFDIYHGSDGLIRVGGSFISEVSLTFSRGGGFQRTRVRTV